MKVHLFTCSAIVILSFIAPTALQSIDFSPGPEHSFNGTLLSPQQISSDCKVSSADGRYWCDYSVGRVGDEVRELLEFRLLHDNTLMFTLDRAPGSDLYISNAGYVAFFDMSRHFRGEVTLLFYSGRGRPLFTRTFERAQAFGFSPDGHRFGVEAAGQLHVLSLPGGRMESYPGGSRTPGPRHVGGVRGVSGKGRVRTANQAPIRAVTCCPAPVLPHRRRCRRIPSRLDSLPGWLARGPGSIPSGRGGRDRGKDSRSGALRKVVIISICLLGAAFYIPATRSRLIRWLDPVVAPFMEWSTTREMQRIARDLEADIITGRELPLRPRDFSLWMEQNYEVGGNMDSWGNLYTYRYWPDSFGIISNGRDLEFRTDDDLVVIQAIERDRY